MDLLTILRVAAIDTEESRLLGLVREIVSLLERKRADLSALGGLIDAERARIDPGKDGSTEAPERPQLHRKERVYAELAWALQRDQADALKMAAALQRKSVEFGEQRQALVGRVSPCLRAQYEAAVRGHRPAVVAARDDACSACAAPLEPEAVRRMREGGEIVPCSGCKRLLHDPGWVERDFMPPTLQPLAKADP